MQVGNKRFQPFFLLKMMQYDPSRQVTKRCLLSHVAGIFDPFQWLTSIPIAAKILITVRLKFIWCLLCSQALGIRTAISH